MSRGKKLCFSPGPTLSSHYAVKPFGRGGIGGGSPPSAISGGIGGGSPPSISGGMGGGSPLSVRMAAGRRRSPAFSAPELQFTRRPPRHTNPKHPNRIFVERMISSSPHSTAVEESPA